jgi:hypothetical protein
MAGKAWRFAGLVALAALGLAIVGGPSAEAAAPISRFEQAKIRAAAIYRKYYFAAQDDSLIADKAIHDRAVKLRAEWNAAFDAAVELDPAVQRAKRAYEAAMKRDEDSDEAGRRAEDLQSSERR